MVQMVGTNLNSRIFYHKNNAELQIQLKKLNFSVFILIEKILQYISE